MKSSSLNEELSNENNWDVQSKLSNADDGLNFEPVTNGPINGPNGMIPERTMRQNNWAIKVTIMHYNEKTKQKLINIH